jgi:hypothetical protein
MMKRLCCRAAAVGAGAITYREIVRPWWRSWGVDGEDVVRELRGDRARPWGTCPRYRSIEIDAPPSDVWPWLLQMGYGRAGWYSYDTIDMVGASSRGSSPSGRSLAVGDVVPTHPGGGFVVRDPAAGAGARPVLRHGIVTSQAAATRDAASESRPRTSRLPVAFLGATQPTEFAASWAFVLEPTAGGHTRLVERFRVKFGETDKPWTAATLPVVGFGVFLMTRQQMLGIASAPRRSPASRPAIWIGPKSR